MKILVLSDIHANIWALEAILEQEKEYDLLCFAGDVVDYGIAPLQVIERLWRLPNTVLVKGNHDRNAVRVFREEDFAHVPKGQYKWVHHNLERMTAEQVDWLDDLPETEVFQADGWAYLVSHQFRLNSYDVIESRHQFEEHWRQCVPEEYRGLPHRRMIFGHTHRQCVHVLDRGMEWLNPGSVSYRRPDDPDKTAHYMRIVDGEIELRQIPYLREHLYREAIRQLKKGRMKETEIQDFFFFFGNAETGRDPLPDLAEEKEN